MRLMHSPDPDPGLRRVEAARYALLRRLTLAMRHHMVVHLQPIALITQVIERRLREDRPDVARIGEDMAKVHGFARAAVGANLDVVSWLAPEAAQAVELDAGVEECVALLRSHFSFRGFQLRHVAGAGMQPVARAAVRMLLPAVLFGLTDEGRAPAEVLIRTEATGGAATAVLEVRETEGGSGEPAHAPYRLLGWDEVQAMAAAEGATLTHQGGSARLRFRAA
jgi:hypothetical protein